MPEKSQVCIRVLASAGHVVDTRLTHTEHCALQSYRTAGLWTFALLLPVEQLQLKKNAIGQGTL